VLWSFATKMCAITTPESAHFPLDTPPTFT
jgi:hypothetical protein